MGFHEQPPRIGSRGKGADQQDAGAVDRAVQRHPVSGIDCIAVTAAGTLERLGT